MNTTLPRTVYDRLHKATTVKYSRSTHQKEMQLQTEEWPEESQPLPPVRPSKRPLRWLWRGVVALVTRNAVRREGVYYLLRKEKRNTPLMCSWAMPLAELCTGLCVLGACDLASVLHW